MSWFKKLFPSKVDTQLKKGVPEGLWTKCSACNAVLYKAELEHQLFVCPKCNHHQRISARVCLNYFLDGTEQQEIGAHVHPVDRLRFRDTKKYKDRIQAAQKQTGETEALIVLAGTLNNMPVVAAAFNFNFIGGSMSPAVGERFVLGAMHALEEKVPYICFCASGGARMQEGLCSLFQMAKTSAALARLSDAGIPFISILMDPTMGGVSASLAMLGDIIVAEPGALIGFAGPRVIEQTMRQVLPAGFQSSEFLLEHGAIDMIVDRRQMRKRISAIVAKLMHHPEILSMEA